MSGEDGKPDAFEQRAGELLRAGADALDGHTRSRLTQARFAAVEAARKRSGSRPVWRGWIPFGGVAAAALAVLLWTGGLKHGGIWQSRGTEPAHGQTPFEVLDLITADENMDMMEEVEFYSWLDSDAASEAVNGVS